MNLYLNVRMYNTMSILIFSTYHNHYPVIYGSTIKLYFETRQFFVYCVIAQISTVYSTVHFYLDTELTEFDI